MKKKGFRVNADITAYIVKPKQMKQIHVTLDMKSAKSHTGREISAKGREDTDVRNGTRV